MFLVNIYKNIDSLKIKVDKINNEIFNLKNNIKINLCINDNEQKKLKQTPSKKFSGNLPIDEQMNIVSCVINEISGIINLYNIEELSALWNFNIKEFNNKLLGKEMEIKNVNKES